MEVPLDCLKTVLPMKKSLEWQKMISQCPASLQFPKPYNPTIFSSFMFLSLVVSNNKHRIFVSCPINFKLNSIIKLPNPSSSALVIGA